MSNTGPSTTNPVNPPKKGRGFRKFLLITFLLIILSGTAYYFICGMTYSEGSRSGVLIKISKRGYLFKTYEGELYIGGFSEGSGTALVAPQIFHFSVYRSNEEIYKKLEQMQGDRMVLYYKQVFKNFFWQGETDYFIYDIKEIKPVKTL